MDSRTGREAAGPEKRHRALQSFVERVKNGKDNYERKNAILGLLSINDPIVFDSD
jgi:hypothetical protein